MDLGTPRLRLRPFVAADHGWLHPITASATVTRYTDWGPNASEVTRAFLDDAVRSGEGPDEFVWAVVMPHGTGIGSAALWVAKELVGLTLEGRLRDHMFVRGAWRDSLLFATVAAN